MNKIKIAHITSVHVHKDIRIFMKECQSLSKKYEVHLFNKEFEGIIEGVIFHKVPFMKNKILRLFTSWYLALIATFSKNYKVIHFHDPELIFATPFWKILGKKVVYDIHENYPKQISQRKNIPVPIRFFFTIIIRFIEVFFSVFIDLIIVVLDDLRPNLAKINKHITIGNIPIIDYTFQKKERLMQFCYIGAMSEERGLLKISKILNKKNIDLVLAGNFSSESFKNQILSFENVRYEGVVARDRIIEIVSDSICGICTLFPTPNHLNSSPNKFFEYLVYGTPVIASNFQTWLNFIPSDKSFIYYVDPESTHEIENAVDKIVGLTSEKINQKGLDGHIFIEKNFNWNKEEKKLLCAYEKLLV